VLSGASGAQAINWVQVDAGLATAGQPGPQRLAELAAVGYRQVINLAPGDSEDAVQDEADILAASGVDYVHIPVDWEHPRAEDFQRFSAAMDRAAGRQTLVHCRVNMRASAFVFLYRVIRLGVDPTAALPPMLCVWTPQGTWREFVNGVLSDYTIGFRI